MCDNRYDLLGSGRWDRDNSGCRRWSVDERSVQQNDRKLIEIYKRRSDDIIITII